MTGTCRGNLLGTASLATLATVEISNLSDDLFPLWQTRVTWLEPYDQYAGWDGELANERSIDQAKRHVSWWLDVIARQLGCSYAVVEWQP